MAGPHCSTRRGFAALILCAGVVCLGPVWAGVDLPTVRLECKGGVFTPARLQVAAGTKFKIEIFNTGTDAIEFESLDLRKEKALNPGGSSFVVVYPLEPGEYRFFDDFHLKGTGGTIVAR
jgi:plastocyanin